MNIAELLNGFTDPCDRREFISGLADAESAITQALEALPESLKDEVDRLWEAYAALTDANQRIRHWEKENPSGADQLADFFEELLLSDESPESSVRGLMLEDWDPEPGNFSDPEKAFAPEIQEVA